LPELKSIKNPDMAYHEKLNITLVGQRLANRLQEKGVGSTIAKDDYPTQVEGFKFTRSYTYSLKTIQEAIARNGSYDFYFDIHRDSQPRNRTTLTYNKQTYAQVYFVVGGKNPAWRKNYQFARRIHDGLERRMPGLSKSIYAKSSNGNGLYNQSISENSALIEIGGPYNTLAECYRTADILADVISEIYYEAVETKGDS
jgi:stage II sporulation protein P